MPSQRAQTALIDYLIGEPCPHADPLPRITFKGERMNYYAHHLGDWARKCAHLTLIEEGAYRRMMDWCYAHEMPLPLSLADIYRHVRARSADERQAVKRVLDEFWTRENDGWHQPRLDLVLSSLSLKNEKEDFRAQRNSRYRERVAQLVDKLTEKGIPVPAKPTMKGLEQLFRERLGETSHASQSDSQSVNEMSRSVSLVSPLDKVLAINQIEEKNSSATEKEGISAQPNLTAAAEACKAMRKAGLAAMNPLDPRLLALLADGATAEELAMVAAEAAARQCGWAWVLATAAGRRRDAANGNASGRPGIGPRLRERAELEAWAPLLQKQTNSKR
jgi:uncharacterized protein YdaU (DUF1376 family)